MPRPAKVMGEKKNLASNKYFISFKYNVETSYFICVLKTNRPIQTPENYPAESIT